MAVATASRPARAARPTYRGPHAHLINQAARRNGIDAWLLAALLWVESRFNPSAVSKSGDYGIAQINLASHPAVSKAEALNPHYAIPWAARYLAELKTQTGSTKAALRAYNTGSGAASPKGTRYASAVLTARKEALSASHLTGSALSSAGYAGVDQGVDFTKTGPIPALDAGKITWVGTETDNEGQPGNLVIEKLTAGPHKGELVYIAETFKPTVHRGQHVRRGQILGRDLGIVAPRTNGVWGAGIEIGFNQAPDRWLPVALNPSAPSPEGYAMLDYINGRSRKARHGGSSVPALARASRGPQGPTGAHGSTGGGGGGGGVTGAVGGFFGGVWGGVKSGYHQAGAALNHVPGVVQAKAAANAASAVGDLAAKILNDPGYIFLWLGFAIVGLAFLFLGVERLLGRSASGDVKNAGKLVAVAAAPEAAAAGGA